MNLRQKACIGLSLCLLLTLSGCKNSSAAASKNIPETVAVETTVPETDPREVMEELAMVVTVDNIRDLEYYPNLKKLDLSGSTCYAAIEEYRRSHPDVDVTYTVTVGKASFDSQTTEIVLKAKDADCNEMLSELQYLHQLTSLSLPGTKLTTMELDAIAEAYPNLTIEYTIQLLDREYPEDVEELDLSAMTPDDLDDATYALSRLNNLKYVELMNDSGSSKLSKSDVKKLVDAAPNTVFHYIFSFGGRNISTTEETVSFSSLTVEEDTLREALAIMSGCKTFIIENCSLDNETMAAIREDYPKTELAWRVQFGKYSAMTNTDTIRAVYNVFDNTCYNLRYCKDVKYMDIGHNEDLTDLSFIGFMPDLEILIASQTSVSDLSGFENCKKLEFLELVFCTKLSDLTPLAGCSNLKNLNICYTKVSNLLALDGLPLERLSCKRTYVGANEQKIFKEIHPDCITMFTGSQPYAGAGWRYVDNGKTYTEIYKKVREVFHYDDLPQT